MSNSLQPHGLQHASLPCPLPSPGVCSNLCPLSQLYYLIISSSAALFSFCIQSFPASGSFLMSWLFPSGGQSIGASATVLFFFFCNSPFNEHSGLISFRIDWASFPCSPGDSQKSSSTPQFISHLYGPTLTFQALNMHAMATFKTE